MSSLAGCSADEPLLPGSGPAERLAVPGLALEWAGDSVAVATADGAVCAVVGRLDDVTAPELAAAYASGAVALAELRGSFALLLWDGRNRRGLLAADPLGTVSWYWHATAGRLVFALGAAELVELLESRPAPSEREVARWLTDGTVAADASLYSGVRRLPGGHHLELHRRAGARAVRHWRPVPKRTVRADRAAVEAELRSTIAAAVARVAGDAEPAVLLSGGLDSAVVGATAARLQPDAVRAYSLVFPEHPAVDESELIDLLARELRLTSRQVPFHGGGLLAGGLDYLRAWGVPPPSPTFAIQAPLLRAAADDGASVLLDGQGGDELFGSSPALLADLVRRGRIGRAHELAARFPGVPDELRGREGRLALAHYGLKGAAPHWAHTLARRVRARRNAPGVPWLSPAAARAYAEAADPWRWQRRDGPLWWRQLTDAVTEQRERAGAHDYLRRRNALVGATGGHPFLQDLDLIELVLRSPPELAFDARHDRALLRSAVVGLVPDRIRLRSGKSFFTPLFVAALDGPDREAITRLLTADDAPSRAYTRPEVVRRELLEAPDRRRGGQWAWALWRLVMLDGWLRREQGRG